MFKLNTIQKTKSGENLMPFAVDKYIVSCFTESKTVVYRKISDFDFTSKPIDKKIITVQAREESNTDVLFAKDELVANKIVEPEVIIKSESISKPIPESEPKPKPISKPEPMPKLETKPEPMPKPEPKPEPVHNTGSIWDTVDDDYI